MAVRRQPSGAGYDSMIAWRLALGRSSAAPSAPSTASTGSSGSSGRTSSTSIDASVSVPVLSRQTVSTRASPSMAGSSCTRHCFLPSRTTPTAKASEVSSTRPSGTMGTRPPTMRRIASEKLSSFTTNCVMISAMPAGTIA